MDAIVVYESLWGNTAEVARAVAEGLGPGARALRTDEVDAGGRGGRRAHRRRRPRVRLQALVAEDARRHPPEPGQGPRPGPLLPAAAHLARGVARRRGWAAAFDTQVRGPFGKGAPEIGKQLEAKGYVCIAEPEGFVVKGSQGPLKQGEAERARAWGERARRARWSGGGAPDGAAHR